MLNALLHHSNRRLKWCRAPASCIARQGHTTGLMVVAAREAQTDLVRQLQARTVKRYYQALVRGNSKWAARSISRSAAIRRSGQDGGGQYRQAGAHALPHRRTFIDCTLVECALETGRTHQIRVSP